MLLADHGADSGELGAGVGGSLEGVDSVGDVGVSRVGVAGEDKVLKERGGCEGRRGQLEGRPQQELGSQIPGERERERERERDENHSL